MLIYQLVEANMPVSLPPNLGKYRCLLLIQRPVENTLRDEVSRLLVDDGCRYVMAWGLDCSAWDDSVDYANIDKYLPNDIPPDRFVMTTWHEDASLEDVLRFAKFDAVLSYDDEPLKNLLVLDFSTVDIEPRVTEVFDRAT